MKNSELQSYIKKKAPQTVISEKIVLKYDTALNNFSKKKMKSLFKCKNFVNMFSEYLLAIQDGSYKCEIPDFEETIASMIFIARKEDSLNLK